MLPLNQMASNVTAFARANAFRYGMIAGPAFLGGIIGAANAEPGGKFGGFVGGALAGAGLGWGLRGAVARGRPYLKEFLNPSAYEQLAFKF
jgi:hypothetical protein